MNATFITVTGPDNWIAGTNVVCFYIRQELDRIQAIAGDREIVVGKEVCAMSPFIPEVLKNCLPVSDQPIKEGGEICFSSIHGALLYAKSEDVVIVGGRDSYKEAAAYCAQVRTIVLKALQSETVALGMEGLEPQLEDEERLNYALNPIMGFRTFTLPRL